MREEKEGEERNVITTEKREEVQRRDRISSILCVFVLYRERWGMQET